MWLRLRNVEGKKVCLFLLLEISRPLSPPWEPQTTVSFLGTPNFLSTCLGIDSLMILKPGKIKSLTVSIVSPSICHEVMGPDAMILVFWILSCKPAFSLFSFTFIKRVFTSSLLSAMGFPYSSVGKESACIAGDCGSIPGSGSSPGEGIGYPLQHSWASLLVQMVKNLPAVWETWVGLLGWEDPLEKGKATHSSILAWRSPWVQSDITEWLWLSAIRVEILSVSLREVKCHTYS